MRLREVSVSAATLLFWGSSHALRPLLPLRLDDLGISDAAIGLVLVAHPIGSVLLALPGGRLVDHIGARLTSRVCFGLMAGCGIGFALATRAWHYGLLLLLAGIVELMTWIGLQSMAAGAEADERASRRLAVFSLGWGIGLAAGPLIGSVLLSAVGFWSLGVAYAVGAVVGAVTLFAVPQAWGSPAAAEPSTGPTPTIRERFGAIVRIQAIQATLASSFVSLFVNAIRMSYYPIALERQGFDVPFIGTSLALMSAASLVVRMPLPWLLSRIGRRRAVLASMWLPIVGISPIPMLSVEALVLTAALICGAGLGMNPPITVELMARHAPDGDRGLAMGARLLANRAAQLAQPMAFAAMLGVTGLTAAFMLSGGALAVATAAASRRIPDLDG